VLSVSKIKLIKSLQQKKYRENTGLFVAEGVKIITELLSSSHKVKEIFCTEKGYELTKPKNNIAEITIVSEKELKKISFLNTPNEVLCIAEIPENKINYSTVFNSTVICLEQVQDPGNMGTIIRIADWFGVSNIICSENTVDVYNPKVVQATMGSISRVNICYDNLQSFLKKANDKQMPVFGAMLNGNSIYDSKLNKKGIYLFGNESKGISEEIQSLISNPILIPGYGSAESLNIAVSVGIVCFELKRPSNITN
jgi:RNA methyltransferase, TrmH family